MLVLSRKINQSLMIAENIEIVIVDIQKDQIKLGISAPKEIPIVRKELHDAIKKSNISAVNKKGIPDLATIIQKNTTKK